MNDIAPLLQVENLSVGFRAGKEILTAVDEANLVIYPGQTIAIVGEAGSGHGREGRALDGVCGLLAHGRGRGGGCVGGGRRG